MEKISIGLGSNSYDILLAPLSDDKVQQQLAAHLRGHGVLAVTDRNLNSTYPDIWRQFGDFRYVFMPGERSKTLTTVMNICGAAAENLLDRDGVIVAVGGGVVGDLSGFAAAIYMRGINFVQIPTSLLAMVDSSVGGKTGADLPEGKNLVGAFHQPLLVIIDGNFLHTLPLRELRNGLAEVVKYGLIMDAKFFALLEENAEKLLQIPLDLELYNQIISRCCQLKAQVVAEDELEQARRAILNFGHTFGHAAELLTSYQLSHGEAVAIGMTLACDFAVSKGLCAPETSERLKALLAKLKLPTTLPAECKAGAMLDAMHRDKKCRHGKIRLILPRQIGEVVIYDDADEMEILDLLRSQAQ